MFLGSFATTSNSNSLTLIPSYDSDILTIADAIFDELYVSTEIVDDFDGTVPSDWNFNTVLHAHFNGDLYGGNVNFTEDIVESIRIKKRTNKDSRFQTIFEREINVNEDFAIELMDYYEPIGIVEYAYVPVISGGESNYIINSVESKFDKHFLVERDASYPMELSVAPSESMVYEVQTVKPLGRKYPITVVNGDSGYYTGEIECLFIDVSDGDVDVLSCSNYRERIYRILTNSKPKILKDYNGNLRLISVNSNITENDRAYLYHNHGGFTYVKSKFGWVETGDAYSAAELYYNGFIDTSLG